MLDRSLPSIRLVPGDGRSKLGGAAVLPRGMTWPVRDGSPLVFVVQLALEELGSPELQSSGTLAFFYAADEQPWGFDPKDAGSSRVVFFANQIQGDVQLEAQLVTNGLYAGDSSAYEDPRAATKAATPVARPRATRC